jgi:hypothetical protein
MSNCSVTPQASPLASRLVTVSPSDATPCNNVTGAPGLLYMVDIDNTGNPVTTHYVKCYDSLSPTVGSTDPDWIFKIGPGERRQYLIPEGVPFAIGLSMVTVTTPGTPGAIDPAAAVTVWLATS